MAQAQKKSSMPKDGDDNLWDGNLFGESDPPPAAAKDAYTAKDIEVLEGLEPVRKRPGMYIGGVDERALHHLFAEVLDNAMDEVVEGHADRIEVEYFADGTLSVTDNGRGIPVDPHPKFPKKSALEVIMTTLHAGGKFSDKAYATSGGLHGVGASVVNALSDKLEVEVAKDRQSYIQHFSRGAPLGPLKKNGPAHNRRGTTVSFHPDPEIFGKGAAFKPARLFQMARSKAYLHRGVEIRWKCAPERLKDGDQTPAETVLKFPNGLRDFLAELVREKRCVISEPFFGRTDKAGHGRVEWAVTWVEDGFGEADGMLRSYCNTVPTPDGGFHETGLRAALSKGLRAYAELKGDRKAALITPEDVMQTGAMLVSVFIHDPQFEGQTKGRLVTTEAAKIVESAVRDPFDHWLAGSPKEAQRLLEWVITQAEDRLRRRKEKEVQRQSATRKLRLPGKLADCSRSDREDTEIFLVEGDSAGGSAKQARNRETQAILPLRGKILNVASASGDKAGQNTELSDLALALGVSTLEVGAVSDSISVRAEGSRVQTESSDRSAVITSAQVDGLLIQGRNPTSLVGLLPGVVVSSESASLRSSGGHENQV